MFYHFVLRDKFGLAFERTKGVLPNLRPLPSWPREAATRWSERAVATPIGLRPSERVRELWEEVSESVFTFEAGCLRGLWEFLWEHWAGLS